ncbi:hypothetical protein CLOM_g13605 [Closterium sp. NIES-68]|nr:hypothetical protein CLOM_g13605 [Closterium sp. NIES-68]
MPLKHVPDARGCSMVILSSPRTLHPNAGTPTVRAGCEWPLTRPPMLYFWSRWPRKGREIHKKSGLP